MISREKDDRSADELTCIWTLAGVLSYRLCECDYNCEQCELYRVLSSGPLDQVRLDATSRGASTGRHPCADEPPGLATHLSHLLAGCRVFLDRPYLPPHFWLRRESDGNSGAVVQAGIDSSLLNLLRPIRRIVATGRGIRLERGQPCGWIARPNMAITLRMPIAGDVVESNAGDPPTAIPGESASELGWLLRIRPPEDLDTLPGLIRGEQTLMWYADRLRVVKEFLREAMAPRGAVPLGELLADGGEAQPCLEDVLGSSAFYDLVARIARS